MSSTSTRLRISPAARVAIRKAITNHDGWDRAFRAQHNYSLASMGRDDYLRAAELLNIDIAEIIRTADDEAGSSTASTADEARAAFDDAPATPAREERRERAAPAGNDDAQDARISKLARMLTELMTTTVDANEVREIVKAEIDKLDLSAAGNNVQRIEITSGGAVVAKIDGHAHPKFPMLLRAASARQVDGYAPNIWIAGPAGSGKTYAVKQVAKALNADFHYNGAIGMAHELMGFVDANGCYHRTAFRDAYEHGGCYLFDEVDGSDNAALLALNAALANGMATFPDGQVERHVDCRIFATGNTWGLGANADYVGRSKIDAAFLDRFGIKIHWGYDEELETAVCGNAEFAAVVQRARKAAYNIGLKVLITPRASAAGAALIAAGASMREAAELTFLANLSDDQKEQLRRN